MGKRCVTTLITTAKETTPTNWGLNGIQDSGLTESKKRGDIWVMHPTTDQ